MSARSGSPRRESRRRRRGLERVDRGSLARGTLPAKRVRELMLAEAWRRVAGAALARRAVAQGVRRGVLELTIADPGWADALVSLIPSLAARLSRRYPDLGIRRFRLQVGGRPQPVRALAADAVVESAAPETPETEAPTRSSQPESEPGAAGADVEEVARRYLERARKRGSC